MKMIRILLWLLLPAGMFSLSGAVLFDPVAQLPVTVWKQEQKAEYRADGLQVSWDTAVNNICIFSVPRGKALPLARFDEATCQVELELPPNSPVNNFNVRFIDAKNEIFQWRIPIKSGGGSFKLKIPMTPTNFFVSFSGNADGKIDFPIRFFSCSTSAPKGSGEVLLTLKRIEYESTLKTTLSDIKFELETGNASRILRPGDESALTLLLRNPGSEITCNATLTLQDGFGHSIEGQKRRLVLPAAGELRFAPQLKLPRFGIWYATLRLEKPDGSGYAEHLRSFAYMVPAGTVVGKAAKDDFIFGICVPGIDRPEVFEQEAETAALCGATALRANFRWRDMERKPGRWDFSIQDRLLATYAKHGIEVMPILSNPPAWSRADGPNSTPDLTAWRDYTGRMFDRFKGRIRFWEIWNEPDLTSFADFGAADYVRLQQIAREEQRRRAPESRLLTGGFASAAPLKNGFQEYVLANAKEYFDIHAFHGHSGYRSYVMTIAERLLPTRKRFGVSAPWYANETAVSALGLGEIGQAETLFKKFLFSWSEGAIGYNWYNLRNNGFDSANPEHNYGLVTCDFYPKAAYVAYNTLATLYRGKRFVSRLDTSRSQRLLEFKGDGDRLVSAWNEAPGVSAEESVAFRTDASKIEAVDLMGNRTNLKPEGEILIHRVSASPETLLFRNCRKLEYLGGLLTGKTAAPLQPGKSVDVTVSCFNPFPHPVAFELTLDGGAALAVHPASATVRLAPGERKSVQAKAAAAAGVHPRSNPILKVRAVWSGGATGINIPLRRAVCIPRKYEAGEWDFVLDRHEQVKSLFEADPSNMHRLWNGPEDLSARIRLKADQTTLTLICEVTDDKHVQPYRGSRVWEGDGIQFAFKFPGQKGLWVAGATLLAANSPETWIWEAPNGFSSERSEALWRLDAARQGKMTRYELAIPFSTIGLTPELLRQGIRFNVLINDNDGHGRDGWIQIAEGIASNRSADLYPLIVFEE